MLRARCMLYCICRKPFDPERMIACCHCNEWYHFDCMKLPCTREVYICPACTPCTEGLLPNHDRSVYCIRLQISLRAVFIFTLGLLENFKILSSSQHFKKIISCQLHFISRKIHCVASP